MKFFNPNKLLDWMLLECGGAQSDHKKVPKEKIRVNKGLEFLCSFFKKVRKSGSQLWI